MLPERQAAQDYFGTLLRTVLGQAFAAAGYHLANAPLQWAGGKFCFVKAFEDGSRGMIDFQALVYSDSAWSAGAPSRFRVQLSRSLAGDMLAARSLSQLVVSDFGVMILPAADHWWAYSDTDSLGKALAEAGHLAIGYGMPWLAGELLPPAAHTQEH
ncbi:MAG: hypothetical protein OXG92_09520 [Chloroflexi bacterium]|nr:hypothetical protein [Chloroflexota bacterium]MCY3581323.1 hypothetical protein [Chloroflexota bacterium]MCY3716687.1 hypothetical protein [Chloroflexota bacterium]MDE2649365.1 hypothetical protein [Chloroflexota bacterium]MXV93433.1 hypothetical protein [Chloroflexota bacterium]